MTDQNQTPSFQREAYQSFDSLNDVEDWLEPLDYATFWREIAKHAVTLPTKASCDARIARGEVTQDVVLNVLKDMAERELCERYNLTWVDRMPWLYGP